jgi:hypothetical protein
MTIENEKIIVGFRGCLITGFKYHYLGYKKKKQANTWIKKSKRERLYSLKFGKVKT